MTIPLVRLKRCFLPVFLCLAACSAGAQQATWIAYPGDFEIWLGNKMQNRRTERGAFFPPFWKLDNHYVLIDFHKDVNLAAAEDLQLFVEGQYVVKIDGKAFAGYPRRITVPAGRHRIGLKVFGQEKVPAVYVQGRTVVSDTSWRVTYEDKEWIDETGKSSDLSATVYLPAAAYGMNDPQVPLSAYALPTVERSARQRESSGRGWLLDFGEETFGYIRLKGLQGKGHVRLYYGESREEALSADHCETLDDLEVDLAGKRDSLLPLSKAFRYVQVEWDGSIQLDSVNMLYEYAPVTQRGRFRCSDTLINRIYEVSRYTFQLNTREFFIDGIKRDRWIWSGDAYQSFLMNYYAWFDNPTVTRTLLALRGKDPVTSHINTIMDYTFYWFLGIYDYYQYTGDQGFIRSFYPRMQSLLEYCLSRRNADGLMEGQTGDWVFIDWADKLSKKGALSFEQLLLCRSLEAMTLCAGIVQDTAGATRYGALAKDLRAKLFRYYWSDAKQALVHSRINGQPTSQVTRYANMFGIFFGYFTPAQEQAVKQHVLLNDSIQQITTPYMRFYELEALCAMGEQAYVTKEMKAYWGNMLQLGATSFWEEYNPARQGAEHYAMYGRPFGKSLCHAWGASPLYLLGKYYLGVQPATPGYARYTIDPALGGLEWIEGAVPTPNGDVQVYCSRKEIRVTGAAAGTGTLRFRSRTRPACPQAAIRSTGAQQYELVVEPGKNYTLRYTAL
jgi:alpha-L-rhamnosidase